MSGINKVILVGNLGKDPEVRHLEGNISVAKFTLATSESYKNKDGNRVDTTEWHNIVMWRKLADDAEKILKKGSLVYIEGKIRTRTYDDKEGHKRNVTEIVADAMTLIMSRKSDNDSSGNNSSDPHKNTDAPAPSIETAPPQNEEGNDLPF